MKKLLNLIRGYLEVEITGAFPERLLNLCAQSRLAFWRVRWLDETTLRLRVSLLDGKELEALCSRSMCTCRELERRGGTAQALRLAQRWGFVLGLVLCLVAVGVLSRFVLVVEVVGNEQVPTAVILSQLRQLGVYPGAYGPAIQERDTANRALTALPELAFMAINIQGTRAVVQVEEVEPVPEILDEDTPADVVSGADGIIEEIHVSAGREMFQEGDVVAQGETLISGVMQLNEIGGEKADMGQLVVHASGEVIARTWRTLEETIPLTVSTKVYTGEEKHRYSLGLLGWQGDFFQNSSIFPGGYDKITKTEHLTLSGHTLPVSLTTTTLRPYTLEETPLDQAQGEQLLRELLDLRLEGLLEEGEGEVLRRDYVTRVEEGRLTVTLMAECREQIGRTVELPGETGHREPIAQTQTGEESSS